MPNRNYLRGRRFEYEIKARWSSGRFKALRTAGSHGVFDIVAYEPLLDGIERLMEFKPGSTREVRRGYEYLTYITPIIGYGIQCKVKKLRKGRTHGKG